MSAETTKVDVKDVLERAIAREYNPFEPDNQSNLHGELKQVLAAVAELIEAIKTANQALAEVAHAQAVGPDWYTRGADGMRNHVSDWVRRGLKASNDAIDRVDGWRA